MSRIGNAPINIPSGVEVKIEDNNTVTVKGPKGQLSEKFDRDISFNIDNGVLRVTRPTDQKRHKALHGLYRALLNNMVIGVSAGFVKELSVIGVGYRATNNGNILELAIGYSHPIFMVLPKEITLTTETLKGKSPSIKLESIDKQLLGLVASKIRALRKPEPYKGKGIRYIDEEVRRKAGKSAAKK
ncbi:MAG: 50S ribosomal protein L6 [Chitinophagales bacterium]|nr:50S ribosomal protein L6 [Chitinophagales bacterium]